MAITRSAEESGGTGHRATSSPLQWNFDCAGGDKLIVIICASALAAVTLSTPTYNGTNMTLVGSQLSFDGGNAKVAIYYMDSPPSGSNQISIPFSSGSATIRCCAGAIALLGTNAGVGANVSGTSASGVTSVSASSSITTASGNYVVSGGGFGSGVGGAAGGGATLTFLVNGSAVTGGDDGIGQWESSTGSAITPSFSWTNNDIGAIMGVEITASGANTLMGQAVM